MRIKQLATSTGALLLAGAVVGASGAPATPTAETLRPAPAASAEARAILARSKDAFVRVRVIRNSTRALIATGTGFLASPDGLALTNYRLIRKIALELVHADGSTLTPKLVAIDVEDDLAVLATGHTGQAFLPLVETWPAKGESAFALGYPRDRAATVVEGTNGGFVLTQAGLRLEFSRALDPGMSGGPVLTPDGQVLGVSVSRLAGDQVVSYLVSTRFGANALLERAAKAKKPPPDFRKEVLAQVSASLAYRFSSDAGATAAMGHYIVPDARASYARCSDNHSQDRGYAHPFARTTLTCRIDYDLFVDDDLRTGAVLFRHHRFENDRRYTTAFADRMERVFADAAPAAASGGDGETRTPYRCHDGFVRRPGGALRVALCLRAYRKFAGLHDLHLRALAVDSSSAALLSTLTITGVTFKDGQALAKRYLETITWTH